MDSNLTPVGGARVAMLCVSLILQLGAGKRNSEHQKHYDKNNFAGLYRYADFRQLKCQYKNTVLRACCWDINSIPANCLVCNT